MIRRKKLSTVGLTTTMATIAEAKAHLVTRDAPFAHTFEADTAKIRPNPDQPRKTFSDEQIADLAVTMAKEGQLQPILVRPDLSAHNEWIIVAGERRWRAAILNKWPKILAMEYTGDHEIAMLVENLQRTDLSLVEEARGIQRLIKEKRWTQAQAATALGKRQGEVSAILRILSLPDDFLDEYLNSDISLSRNALIELCRVEEGAVRDRLLDLARAGKLTISIIRAARCEINDASADRQPAKQVRVLPDLNKSSQTVTSKSLFKMAERLRSLREMREVVGAEERQALIQLREEIDGVLSFATEFAEA
jgi:ParB family chromosome partitioning protein